MAYERLDLAQEEQIRVMRKDGKSVEEVQKFFKDTYKKNLPAWKVSYIVSKSGQIATGGMKQYKRARKFKKSVADDRGGEDGNVVEEVVNLIREIDAGYKAIFAHFRSELIKSRAELHGVMKGAGIPVNEEVDL